MEIVIEKKDSGKTVRDFLRGELGFSAAYVKKLKFAPGGILVNGVPVRVPHVLEAGDVLVLATEDTEEDVSPYITAVDLPLPVLFEDDSLTVVNKPPDMPAHPSFGHRDDTAANALAFRYRERPYVFRPVNRLDRDTSGVMLTANTKHAAYRMFLHMREGRIRKRYIAVTEGVPAARSGVIHTWMRRQAESIIIREICDSTADGAHEALTEYRVLADNGTHSVVLVSPLTGRTHQIRVHLTSLGCPLCGDTLYGQPSPYIGRHALHAVSTSFPHPDTEREMTVSAPLPEDMCALICALFSGEAEDVLASLSDFRFDSDFVFEE